MVEREPGEIVELHALSCPCERCRDVREIRQMLNQMLNQRNARRNLHEIVQEI